MTNQPKSGSKSPDPYYPGSNTGSGYTASPGYHRLPEGSVTSQVMRMQRQQDHFSLPRPYAEMVRDGEQSGWGRRVEGTVRLVKPASRFNVIEPEHKLLKPIHSSHIRHERPQRTKAEPAGSSPAAGGAKALLPSKARPHNEGNKRPGLERSTPRRPGSDYIGLSSSSEVARSPMPAANEAMTSPSTPSELRQEARQMFESDEHWDDRGPWRPCHVCSSKVTAGPFCSVCDHPLCSTCICDLPPEPARSQRDPTTGTKPTVSSPLREDVEAYRRLPYGSDLKSSPFPRADLSKRSLPGVTQANLAGVDETVQHPPFSDCVPKRGDSQPQPRDSGQQRLEQVPAATQDVTSHLSRRQSGKVMSPGLKSPPLPSRAREVQPNRSTTINSLHGAQADNGPLKEHGHCEEVDQGQHVPDHPADGLASHGVRTGLARYASKESTTIATPSNPSPFTIPALPNRKPSITQKASEVMGLNWTPKLRKMQSMQLTGPKQDGSRTSEIRQATQQAMEPSQSSRSRLSKFSTRSTSQLVERWNGEVRSSRPGSQAGPYLDYRSDLRHHESEQTTPRAEIPTTDFRGLLKHYSPPGPHISTSSRKVPSSPALSKQPSIGRPLDHRPSDLAKKHSTHKSRGSHEACGYCEPEGAYGSLTSVPEQEVWDKDASSPPPARGRAFSRHASGNRGSIPEQGQIHGEQRPLRRVKTRDSHEWAKLRGMVERDAVTSPPTSAYATGLSEVSVSTTITGTSPRAKSQYIGLTAEIRGLKATMADRENGTADGGRVDDRGQEIAVQTDGKLVLLKALTVTLHAKEDSADDLVIKAALSGEEQTAEIG